MNDRRAMIGVLWVALAALLLSAPGSTQEPAAGLGNYLLLVDTSGSMAACYAPGPDGSPSMVNRFVSALITDVMAPGDNLIIIPFDLEVRDDPKSSAVILDATTQKAAEELKRIGLTIHQGKGTRRSSAIGRGLRRLENLLARHPDAQKRKNAVVVVSDRDNDVDPGSSYADDKRFHDAAVTSKALQLADTFESGALMVSIYKYRPQGTPMSAGAQELPLAQLQTVVNEIFGRLVKPGVLRDLSEAGLVLSIDGEPTVGPGMASVTLPLKISSTFTELHAYGTLRLNVECRRNTGAKARSTADACRVTSTPTEIQLAVAPDGSSDGAREMEVPLTLELPRRVGWYDIRGASLVTSVGANTDDVWLTTEVLEGADVEVRRDTLGVRWYPYSAESTIEPASVVVTWRPSIWPVLLICAGVIIILLAVPAVYRLIKPPWQPITVHAYFGPARQSAMVTIVTPGPAVQVTQTGGASVTAGCSGRGAPVMVEAEGATMSCGGQAVSAVEVTGDSPVHFSIRPLGDTGADDGQTDDAAADEPPTGVVEFYVSLAPFTPPASEQRSEDDERGWTESDLSDEEWLNR